MLDHIVINDYRALRVVDVPLKPLTILIGPNNTGKSSFLSAVELLKTVGAQGNPTKKVDRADLWRLDGSCQPLIHAHCQGFPDVQVRRNQGVWHRSGDNSHVVPLTYFNTLRIEESMTSPGAEEKQGIPEIKSNAENLPAYLDALLRKDRDRFFRVQETLRKLIPGFQELNIATPETHSRRIDLEFEHKLLLSGQYASYGVKLLIFFVCLANHPAPPNTILLDEPETGVHPKRLKDITRLLIELTEGKLSNQRTQVIATTHSPQLLNYINPEEHQVLVFERNHMGECLAQPVDTNKLKFFLDDFTIGEVWLNQDEKGLVEKGN